MVSTAQEEWISMTSEQSVEEVCTKKCPSASCSVVIELLDIYSH